MNTNIQQFIKHFKKAMTFIQKDYPDCNVLQPGFLKEVVIANDRGHTVEPAKHLCDAYDKAGKEMEYLTCQEDGVNKKGTKLKRAFAIDCVFSSPPKLKEGSLKRIRRNKHIYYAVFKEGTLELLELWIGKPKDLEEFVDKNVTKRGKEGKNTEHTVSISKKWVRDNCKRLVLCKQ